MTFIVPEIGWFEIAEVPIVDKSSAIIYQIFIEIFLLKYPMRRKVIFYNGSGFKSNHIPLLKYFYVKLTCTTIKNIQANSILGVINQVVGIMLKTKYLANVTFDTVALWSYMLAYIADAM